MGKRERGLAEEMVATMRAADGVGLAAPQVGVNRRLVVIEVPDGCDSDDPEDWNWDKTRLFFLINPVITAMNDLAEKEEGCLSLPGFVATISRARQVVAVARDLDGHKLRFEATGLLAHALQHEVDHLDGILVSNRAGSVLAMRQVKPPWVAGGRKRSRREKNQPLDEA